MVKTVLERAPERAAAWALLLVAAAWTLSPVPTRGQVNIGAPCKEDVQDARTPFAYVPEGVWPEPSGVPLTDLGTLISHLGALETSLAGPGQVVPGPVTPAVSSTVSTPEAYRTVRTAADDLRSVGDSRRTASLEFRAMDEEQARSQGFRLAQEAALESYAEHDRLLAAQETAIQAEKSTLQTLCNNLERARSVAGEGANANTHVRGIDESVQRWWMLTTTIRAELKAQHPGLPDEHYPLDEFPDLDWSGPWASLQLDRGVPVQNGARALHRIDQELHSIHELDAYVDAELAADVAKSALVFVQAVHDAAAPDCDGDLQCLAPLQAEVIAATGAAEQAEARRRAARQRFDTTFARVNTLPDFHRRQRQELDRFGDQVAAPRTRTDRIRDLVRRARDQAVASCRALAEYIDVDPAPCALRAVDATHIAVNPPITPPGMWDVGDHVFRLFNSRDREPAGYGAYTYVLFSKRAPARARAEDFALRYRTLLEAIVDNTDSALEGALPRPRLNLFAIPTTAECLPDQSSSDDQEACDVLLSSADIARDLDQYNVGLSRKLLAEARAGQLLRSEILSVLKDSPGPFLLTTPERLLDADQSAGYAPLLLLDLSDVDPGSYLGYVQAYKQTIVDSPPSDQVIWEPPRPDWFRNGVLTVGRHLPKLVDTVRGMLAPRG